MHDDLHNYIRTINNFLTEHSKSLTPGVQMMPLRVNAAVRDIFTLLTGIGSFAVLPVDDKHLGIILSSVRLDVARVVNDYDMTTSLANVDGNLVGRLVDTKRGITMSTVIYQVGSFADVERMMKTNPVIEATLH